MNLQLQIILLIILLGFMAFLIHQVKENILDLKYTLAWFLLGAGLLVVTCVPKSLILISKAMGIAAPINTVFFLGFGFSLIIIYVLTISLSRMSLRIRILAQKIAILEKSIEDINNLK